MTVSNMAPWVIYKEEGTGHFLVCSVKGKAEPKNVFTRIINFHGACNVWLNCMKGHKPWHDAIMDARNIAKWIDELGSRKVSSTDHRLSMILDLAADLEDFSVLKKPRQQAYREFATGVVEPHEPLIHPPPWQGKKEEYDDRHLLENAMPRWKNGEYLGRREKAAIATEFSAAADKLRALGLLQCSPMIDYLDREAFKLAHGLTDEE